MISLMPKPTRKCNYLDCCKGVAIILVTWGHVLQVMSCNGSSFVFFDNKLVKLIYSVHMPFFMMLSGVLHAKSERKYGLAGYTIKRCKECLKPILVWSGFSLLCSVVYFVLQIETQFITLRTIYSRIISSLWFLWTLLECTALLCLIDLAKRQGILNRIIGCIGIMITFVVFPNKQFAIWLFPFYLLGSIGREWIIGQKKIRIWQFVLSVLIYTLLLTHMKSEYFVYVSELNTDGGAFIAYNIYRFGIGISGCICLVCLIRFMYEHLALNVMISNLSLLGQYTMELYLIQTILISSVFNRVYRYLFGLVKASSCYIVALSFLITVGFIVTMMLNVSLIKRNDKFYKFLFR